ncbi:hypothetical protein LX64_01228 [Chitinophaga skermanii]|uniref:Spermatogenesis-associated protein 20-like TRX domain-containing protein n=1 Tax=Chitinophaga skermanii TaxID=331697 RepID=A0A327QX86_9BACT|nr:DUF255 domain-containing protein [Chitinophaga skermanii]RAJ08575.1 hypothetical protein LX64_01228 [Chitinophaga skermanii]
MYKHILWVLCVIGWWPVNGQHINWQNFDKSAFQQAMQQNKPLLLDLGASWCHWCHVMDDSTYENPTIVQYINDYYIPTRANQDKRPDLYAKYKDYGWPATIIFSPEGNEVYKEAGYISPETFLPILQTQLHSSPITNTINNSPINYQAWTPAVKKYILDNFYYYLDTTLGAYDMSQKYIEYDGIDYAMYAAPTNKILARWLQTSITQSFNLNDTAWGGVYQYSTNRDWQHPHYEKLLGIQARYLKMYARYYALKKDASTLARLNQINSYLQTFLASPNGLYYNSQDADLIAGQHAAAFFTSSSAERLHQGIPRIDSACYAKENAQLAEAFLYSWAATGDTSYLQKAKKILTTLTTVYNAPNGGVYHDLQHTNLPLALGDQLYFANALLLYYQASGDTGALHKSVALAQWMQTHLLAPPGGLESYERANAVLPPGIVMAENIDACRFFNRLSYNSDKSFKSTAQQIFRYLTQPSLLKHIIAEPGLLLAQVELSSAPTLVKTNRLVFIQWHDYAMEQ